HNIQQFNRDTISNEMMRAAGWVKWVANEDGSVRQIFSFPDVRARADMLATPARGNVPVLHGIITMPRVAKDGSIDVVPGYKPELGMIYMPPAGFVVPEVPEVPTEDDLDKACELLLGNAFEGFCFKD